MIDVKHRSLRTLEKNARAVLDRAVDCESDIFGDWKNSMTDSFEHLHCVINARALPHTECSQLGVGVRNSALDACT
jgi:hypothetical protein